MIRSILLLTLACASVGSLAANMQMSDVDGLFLSTDNLTKERMSADRDGCLTLAHDAVEEARKKYKYRQLNAQSSSLDRAAMHPTGTTILTRACLEHAGYEYIDRESLCTGERYTDIESLWEIKYPDVKLRDQRISLFAMGRPADAPVDGAINICDPDAVVERGDRWRRD